jgi:ectoine hydroxylase-related dioxygenase (phytanoyl-CoA dioxygenase family)
MLTREQLASFETNGFVNAGPVISAEEADLLAAEVLRVIERREDTTVPQPVMVHQFGPAATPIWQIVNICDASPMFMNLVHNLAVTEAAVQVLKARELRLWHDQIQYKVATKGGVNMWHQDSPLWPSLAPKDQQITCWIALDDADVDNGCMSMVPGSYRWGNQIEYLGTIKSYDQMPKEFQGKPSPVQLTPVKKGHLHMHHSLTWHGSHANTSGRPRRAIALHYMSEKTVYIKEGKHPMDPYIHVADRAKIEGIRFPLVARAH